MTRIRAVDPVTATVEVEAGAVLQAVREAAAEHGRDLPIVLASQGSATIGGLLATNAGGLNVLRHGMTRALALGVEVVLADGTVVDGLRHLRKDNAGYDWKHLFIGAEGTLGIITAAVLRLVPQPRHSATALVAVPDVEAALALFGRASDALGEALSAFELVSSFAFSLVERHAGLAVPVRSDEWYVLLEAESVLPGLRDAALGLLEDAFDAGFATDGVLAESTEQARRLWALRERVTESEAAEGASIKHDVSLPLREFPAFLREAGKHVTAVAPGARPAVFGHIGDGNLHYNVLLPEKVEAVAVNRAVHDLVIAHGGSISAEHGLGKYRVDEWQRLAAPAERELCARLKASLDPAGLLNPGKVLPRGMGSAPGS